jgi:hypothetical protein
MLFGPYLALVQDWQWDGRAEIPQRQRVREPATIHLTVGDRSSINYTLPMVMGPSGYQPVLDIHLDTPVVTSSLNDIRLVTAESCRVGVFLLLILTVFHQFQGPLRTTDSTEVEPRAQMDYCCISTAAHSLSYP